MNTEILFLCKRGAPGGVCLFMLASLDMCVYLLLLQFYYSMYI